MLDWKPIATIPTGKKIYRLCFIVCHAEKKWVRFGCKLPGQKEWYYSGTNERSQYSMMPGDEPTHWAEIGPLPTMEPGHD